VASGVAPDAFAAIVHNETPRTATGTGALPDACRVAALVPGLSQSNLGEEQFGQ